MKEAPGRAAQQATDALSLLVPAGVVAVGDVAAEVAGGAVHDDDVAAGEAGVARFALPAMAAASTSTDETLVFSMYSDDPRTLSPSAVPAAEQARSLS